MSLDLTFYLGLAVELDKDKDYWDIIEEHKEFSPYEFENKDAKKPGVRFINDGMCGQYAYLMYVIDTLEQEDMYNGRMGAKEIDTEDLSSMVAELNTAYQIFEGKPLESKPKFIRLFHCS